MTQPKFAVMRTLCVFLNADSIEREKKTRNNINYTFETKTINIKMRLQKIGIDKNDKIQWKKKLCGYKDRESKKKLRISGLITKMWKKKMRPVVP